MQGVKKTTTNWYFAKYQADTKMLQIEDPKNCMVHMGQLQITMRNRINGPKRDATKCCANDVENYHPPKIFQRQFVVIWIAVTSLQSVQLTQHDHQITSNLVATNYGDWSNYTGRIATNYNGDFDMSAFLFANGLLQITMHNLTLTMILFWN